MIFLRHSARYFIYTAMHLTMLLWPEFATYSDSQVLHQVFRHGRHQNRKNKINKNKKTTTVFFHGLQLKKKKKTQRRYFFPPPPQKKKCLAMAQQRWHSLQFYRFYIELSRVTSSDDTAVDPSMAAWSVRPDIFSIAFSHCCHFNFFSFLFLRARIHRFENG